MPPTTDQVKGFIDKVALAGTQPAEYGFAAGGLISCKGVSTSPRQRPRYSYHASSNAHDHVAMDLPPVAEADMWCEQTVTELARAREVILERGWIKGSLSSQHGVCALGAVAAATDVNRLRTRAVSEVLRLFLNGEMKVVSSVAFWNDQPERTQDEVLDLLHRCQVWVKEKIKSD